MINGTVNLLRACLKSKSVKRVVFTSSISTITAKDSNEEWRPVVDESCQTSIDHIWNTKASGWVLMLLSFLSFLSIKKLFINLTEEIFSLSQVYALSKLLTEEAAFKFATENGIDLVSVITSTVADPFLTSNVPSSIQVLLSPITGAFLVIPMHKIRT